MFHIFAPFLRENPLFQIQEIAKLGVFSTPALVIDGEVKCVGKVPEEKELISWLG